MATKEEYLAKLKTQLDSWQVEADELQAKAEVATDELKVELEKQLADLRVKFAEGETKLGELADATEEMWEDLKGDAEAMYDKLVAEYGDEAQEVVASAQGLFAKIKSIFK
jgi:hypothetical protein